MNVDLNAINEECIKLNLSGPRERIYLIARIVEEHKVVKSLQAKVLELIEELRIQKEISARVEAALIAAIRPR